MIQSALAPVKASDVGAEAVGVALTVLDGATAVVVLFGTDVVGVDVVTVWVLP